MSDVFSDEEKSLCAKVSGLEESYAWINGKIHTANQRIMQANKEIEEWVAYKADQARQLAEHRASLVELRAKISEAFQPKVEVVTETESTEDSFSALENRSNVEKSHGKSKNQRIAR